MTKIYHRAKHIHEDGAVSALCFKRPRAINLSIASWTLVNRLVTCPKCKAIIAANIKTGKKRGW